MDNNYFHWQMRRIDEMGADELKDFISSCERDLADPYPDDDQAGDIATGIWLSRAKERLKGMP